MSGNAPFWIAALAFHGFACTEPVEPDSVLLLLVDTLRADHLGAYGYSRDTSPHLDAFARNAVLFGEARSQSPCTFPSVASLLTSLHPERFAFRWSLGFGIPPKMTSLAQILQARGFHTAAVSASPIVRSSPSRENPEAGFGRGFEVFDESCLGEDASCVNAAAQRLLDSLASPFFLYLHYMEPHDPYRPPASHSPRFGDADDDFLSDGDPRPLARQHYREGRPLGLTDSQRRRILDRYDEEIAYFDARFGELLEILEKRGLARRTIVVVASDHGEEFLEHGDFLHCRNLHDTQIHTPLVMRVPGVAGGRRVDAPVRNLDLVPTLLDYLGVSDPGPALDGRSLRKLIELGTEPDRPAFAAWQSWRAVVDGRYKFMMDLDSGNTRLYDLANDPGETTNLATERPQEVARLRGLIEAHGRGLPQVKRENQRALTDRLRALGYLE